RSNAVCFSIVSSECCGQTSILVAPSAGPYGPPSSGCNIFGAGQCRSLAKLIQSGPRVPTNEGRDKACLQTTECGYWKVPEHAESIRNRSFRRRTELTR